MHAEKIEFDFSKIPTTKNSFQSWIVWSREFQTNFNFVNTSYIQNSTHLRFTVLHTESSETFFCSSFSSLLNFICTGVSFCESYHSFPSTGSWQSFYFKPKYNTSGNSESGKNVSRYVKESLILGIFTSLWLF